MHGVGHESSRSVFSPSVPILVGAAAERPRWRFQTTQLYGRRNDDVTFDEAELILI